MEGSNIVNFGMDGIPGCKDKDWEGEDGKGQASMEMLMLAVIENIAPNMEGLWHPIRDQQLPRHYATIPVYTSEQSASLRSCMHCGKEGASEHATWVFSSWS